MVYPHPAELAALNTRDLPVRLQARLIELSSCGCQLAQGPGAWEVTKLLAKDPKNHGLSSSGLEVPQPELPKKAWEHIKDLTIEGSLGTKAKKAVDLEGAWKMHYDGGCRKKAGSGDFVLWGKGNEWRGGEYKYYGSKRPTNNESEAQAMVDGVKFAVGFIEKGDRLVVRGDS